MLLYDKLTMDELVKLATKSGMYVNMGVGINCMTEAQAEYFRLFCDSYHNSETKELIGQELVRIWNSGMKGWLAPDRLKNYGINSVTIQYPDTNEKFQVLLKKYINETL